MIKILGQEEYDQFIDQYTSERDSEGSYETWEIYHNNVIKVISRFGTHDEQDVDEPDFYHSGDWFHERSDGVAVFNYKVISNGLISELQEVARQHHENANIYLVGDEEPITFLEFFITPNDILVSKYKLTESKCREFIKKTLPNLSIS